MTVEMAFLGNTGLRVSRLCLGAMTFGEGWRGVGGVDEGGVQAIVSRALDAGITFFDTADIYNYGQSERLLGSALREVRSEVVIATKVRGRMSDHPNDVGLSRAHILESVDRSLRNLGTDYIDLYQVHGWDPRTPLEETLRALEDVVRWGKVRYIGVSNFAGWHLMKALCISGQQGWTRFVTLQAQYSLVNRDVEHELVPLCLDQGLGFLPWSPLGGGFLTGKYRRGLPRPEGARRSDPVNQFLQFDEEKGFEIVETLDAIGRRHDATVAQTALAWLLAKPVVSSVIIGARSVQQLEDNLGAVRVRLDAAEVERLDALSATPLPYPYRMIAHQAEDR